MVRRVAFQLGSLLETSASRRRVGRVAQERVHGARHLSLALGCLDLRHAGEVGATAVGELGRKLESSDSGERRGEVVNRVVLHRPRAVSAGIRHFEPVVLRKFLTRLDVQRDPVPVVVEFPGSAFVERECGIDELAAVLGEPFGPVERSRRLLAAGQRHFQGAPRLVVLGAVADERVEPDGRFGLVVARAARVERAVLLHQRERVAGPVLAFGFDHVDVRKQQDGLQFGIPPRIDDDETALLGVVGRGEGMQVGVRNTRRLQARGHALGGERATPSRQRGVRLDEFLVELAKALLARRGVLGRRRQRSERNQRGCDRKDVLHEGGVHFIRLRAAKFRRFAGR